MSQTGRDGPLFDIPSADRGTIAAMSSPQPGVLAPVPAAGRFLTLTLARGASVADAVAALAALPIDDGIVVGVGASLLEGRTSLLGALRPFPSISAPGVSFPSTQGAAWVFLRGDDAAALLVRARGLVARLEGLLDVAEDIAAFRYDTGRDLSGYEDGTENPTGDDAARAALDADGASFVAVQRWVHDLARFEGMSAIARDHVIGRNRETNDELPDAPESAHVKRAAQESFEPPAFMLRRSMPYGDLGRNGLYFVAYGASLDAFEHVLTRMAGVVDGITDALLTFSRAETGGYYWCPPTREGRLDLRALATR